MNICIFTRTTSLHGIGGFEQHIDFLAEGLIKCGHNVTVITTSAPHTNEYVKVNGVSFYLLKNTKSRAYSSRFWSESVKKFEELHKKSPFDIAWSEGTGGFGYVKYHLRQKCDVPFVSILQGTHYDDIKTRFRFMSIFTPIRTIKSIISIFLNIFYYFYYGLPLLRYSDATIATSNEQEQILKKYYFLKQEKIYKVFNGIDTHLFAPDKKNNIRKSLNIQKNDRIILTIARLEKDKGIQHVIKTIPKITQQIPNTKLVIIGDGPYKQQLETEAKKTELGNNIIFTGFISFTELPYYINASDLFINFTLKQNGYDLTILEAMACEKPVVVSDLGSIPTVIEDGVNGVLVPPGDVGALAGAVVRVLKDKDFSRSIGESARNTVVEKFSIESMVGGTIDVYKGLLKKKMKN